MQGDPLTRWLSKRFVPEGLPAREKHTRTSLLEGYVSVVLNTLLFGVKLALGVVTGSVALMADAVHTIADSLTSGVVIASAYVARRPPDPKHPFGYGRVESVSAVVIAVLLGVAGLEFAKASVGRLLEPGDVQASWLAIAAVAATLVVKIWMSVFALHLGRSSGSKMLEADAWHHATDVFATVPVIVAMIAGRYGYERVDGVMGLLVALVILWAAFDIARDATRPLLGEPPSPDEIAEIERLAMGEPDVRGVHDIVVHKYGHTRVVSLHIETPTKAALELHALAERVEARVGRGEHGDVVVHVDPVDRSHPHYEVVRDIFARAVADDERLESFHDLRVFGTPPALEVTADLGVQATLGEQAEREIQLHLGELVRARFLGARVRAFFEPVFAYRVHDDEQAT